MTNNYTDFPVPSYQLDNNICYANQVSGLELVTGPNTITLNGLTAFASNNVNIGNTNNENSIAGNNVILVGTVPSKVWKITTPNTLQAGYWAFSNSCLGVSGSYAGSYAQDVIGNGNILRMNLWNCSGQYASITAAAIFKNTTNQYQQGFIGIQSWQGVTGNNATFVIGGIIVRNTLSAQSGFSQCTQLIPQAGNSSAPCRQTYNIPTDTQTVRTISVTAMVDASYTANGWNTNTSTSGSLTLTMQYYGQSVTSANFSIINAGTYNTYNITYPGTLFNEPSGMNFYVDVWGNNGNVYLQGISWK